MNNARVEYTDYTVKKGDSLYTIAKKFNTTVANLTDVNMLTSNTIFPGQVLLIPTKTVNTNDYYFESYIVEPGDTVSLIASKKGVDPVLIGLYNDIASYELSSGQTIKIPRNNAYVVKDDETVDSILVNTNRTADELLRANATIWLKSGSNIFL